MGRIFNSAASASSTTITFPSSSCRGTRKAHRDNLTILAETTEALCDNVAMRQQSGEHAAQLQLAQNSAVAAVERLRLRQQQISLDTRLLLQEMIDGIEKAYAWLDTAPNQEAAISTTMEAAVHNVLEMLGAGNEQDAADFQRVLDVLRIPRHWRTTSVARPPGPAADS
jgi:DNA-binding GntR family transcriptional regulator